MTLYDTRDSLFPFSAGLYYGRSVSPTVRQEMDKVILLLRMDDKINEIVKQQGGSPLVTERKTIGTRIVGETVAIYSCIFVLSFLVLIFLYQRQKAWPAGSNRTCCSSSEKKLHSVHSPEQMRGLSYCAQDIA